MDVAELASLAHLSRSPLLYKYKGWNAPKRVIVWLRVYFSALAKFGQRFLVS